MVAVVLLLAAFLVPVNVQAAQPVVWVFGTSIPAGVGTTCQGCSWPSRYAQLTGSRVRVFAVGGAVFDPMLGQGASVISDQVRGVLTAFPNEKPSRVFVDAGTNDLVSHNDMGPVFWQVIGVDLLLQSRGVHGTYLTILPMGFGSSHPDGWVPVLTARAQRYNTWLRAMGAAGAFRVADMAGVLHEGPDGVISAPWVEADGLHPGDQASLLVAGALAGAE
jgi:hypothetical protein